MNRFICIDCETTGLDSRINAPISLYVGLFDDNACIDHRYWEMSPSPNAVITSAAMSINKLNLQELNEHGYSLIEVQEGLQEALKEWSKEGKLMPVGWNVCFDLNFIHDWIMPKELWNDYVSHRFIDVMGLSRFWWNMGSLEKTCASQGIIMAAHNAAEDANATWKVYKKLESIRDASKFALH